MATSARSHPASAAYATANQMRSRNTSSHHGPVVTCDSTTTNHHPRHPREGEAERVIIPATHGCQRVRTNDLGRVGKKRPHPVDIGQGGVRGREKTNLARGGSQERRCRPNDESA